MFVAAEVWTIARTEKGNAVLVRPVGGNLAVPIFIGALEAQNILLGMGDVDIPRPMTHDLMLNILQSLGGRIVQIEIHTLNEGTFFANIILEQDGRRTTLDSRPSDALALAVRASCPVYIEDSIVEEAGIATTSVKGAPQQEEDTQTGFDFAAPAEEREETGPQFGEFAVPPEGSSREELEKQLKYLVEQEMYEEAARIRDELKKFD